MDNRHLDVVVVDYGMGNLNSVRTAFESLGATVAVSSSPSDLERADRIVLPGVGAFGEGMRNLNRAGLIPLLARRVFEERIPFLGICLGMQLLARESLEHGRHPGLGWIPARVQPFSSNDQEIKQTHIGWNDVVPTRPSALLDGLGGSPNFYFVHSYFMECDDHEAVSARSAYGQPFVAAIEHRNLAGVQFHPEKSQEAGLALLRRFLSWRPADNGTHPMLASTVTPQPKVRLIPTVLLHRGRMVKTVRFQLATTGLRRDVGHPVKTPTVYDAQLADELVYLDIRSTVEGRPLDTLAAAIGETAGVCFMPITAGGGVRSTDDVRRLLKAGADKVAINTAAVERPALVTEAADRFGSQCVVVAVDARRAPDGRYYATTRSGTVDTGETPWDLAQRMQHAGAGEILLTSVDRDGTMEGYDLELCQRVASSVRIPVVLSGGAGRLADLVSAIRTGGAAAVGAASLFHFTDQSPIKAKAFMRRSGLSVR